MEQIPSAAELKDRLKLLSHAGMQDLAKVSAVPFTTLWKIRNGETADPRLETVRQVWPTLLALAGAADAEPAKV